jgi:O-antigen/teichoic acid export membrane protein
MLNDAPKVVPVESASRRIARNATSILLGDAAGEILNGYAIVLAAVSLGPSGFGTLSEAQAFMDPIEAISALGLGSVALTIAASRGGCDETLRGTVLGIRMLSASLAGLIGIAAAFVTGRGALWPLLVVVAVGMFATPVTMVSTLPFQWNQAVHRRIALPLFVGALRLCTAYLAFWLLRRPLGYQLATMTAGFGAAGINWWWASRVYPGRLRFDRALARSLLVVGWPVAVLEFVVLLYSRAAYFFLHDIGPRAQGEFAAADRMIKPVLAIAGAIFVSSLPTIADLAVKGEYRPLKASYKRALLGITAGVTPILAAAWFLSAWLLHRFAPVYADSIWPFRVLAVGAFFMFFNMLSATYIMALGKFRVIMTIAIVNLVVYLILASRLVPTHAAMGAAFSTSLMEAINTMMQVVVVYHLLNKLAAERDRAGT